MNRTKALGVAAFAALLLLGFFGGSAARHFVWDSYRRYEILPWLIPGEERIALALFRGAICGQDPLIKDGRTLLRQAGYYPPKDPEDDSDRFGENVEFAKPLRLSVPAFGIKDWDVVQYFWEGDSGGISGIEVRQPLGVVAKTLHLPAVADRNYDLRIRTAGYGMQGDIGMQLSETERGTRIGCWFVDG
jgi:hypothetical protein